MKGLFSPKIVKTESRETERYRDRETETQRERQKPRQRETETERLSDSKLHKSFETSKSTLTNIPPPTKPNYKILPKVPWHRNSQG